MERDDTQHQQALVKSPKFKVGDIVTFTNDYGVRWPNKTIIGTEYWHSAPEQIRYFYAPSDCPWFSVREESLKLEA